MQEWRHIIGVSVVLLIGVTWCASTQLSEAVVQRDQVSPVFSGVFGTCLHLLYLPCYLVLVETGKGSAVKQNMRLKNQHALLHEPSTWYELTNFVLGLPESLNCCRRKQEGTQHLIEWHKASDSHQESENVAGRWMGSSMVFWLLWSVANFSYISALQFIDAGIVTALFNTAPAWVAILSYWLLNEGDRPAHVAVAVAAAALAVAGAMCVVFGSSGSLQGEHSSASKQLTGCGLSLLAAVAAALYKVLYRRVFGASTVRLAFMLLTTIGLIMCVAAGPILGIVLGLGLQRVDWASFPWGLQLLASAAGMAFNLCIAVGVARTYPLYVAVGTILGLPLNVLVDWLRGASVGILEGIGMVLVGASFVSLSVADAACHHAASSAAASKVEERACVPREDSNRHSGTEPSGSDNHLSFARGSNAALAIRNNEG